MKERLLELLKKDYYGKSEEDCICVNCVLNMSDANLLDVLNELEQKRLENLARKYIKIIDEFVKDGLINYTIHPFLIAVAIYEEMSGKKEISLKELRKNALIIGCTESWVQYLWYSQHIREEHPNFDEKRINRIMFTNGLNEEVKPVEIGILNKKNRIPGYVLFIPELRNDGVVEMAYHFYSNVECF